jgi:hypothetical protein
VGVGDSGFPCLPTATTCSMLADVVRLLSILTFVLGAGPALAAEPALTWYVAPSDELASWTAAAATTWPAGVLAVVQQPEPFPLADATLPHAYYLGTLPGGEVVLRTADGERRLPVELEGGEEDEARRGSVQVRWPGGTTVLAEGGAVAVLARGDRVSGDPRRRYFT